MPRSSTAQLTVTVGGRRLNHCKVLEEKAHALIQQIRRLQKQNGRLRCKEAMQLDMLKGYDDSMEKMSCLLVDLADQSGPDAAVAREALSAVMLALREGAQSLLQQVRSGAGSADGQQSPPHSPSTVSTATGKDRERPGSAATPIAGARHTRIAWSRVTPEAVLEMQRITTRELAEKFKRATMRIALVQQCRNKGSVRLTDTLDEAVLAYGELILLAMVGGDEKFLEFNLWNMEKMQRDPLPDGLMAHVLKTVPLTQQQRQQLALAYECTQGQRMPLLQQQAGIVRQLQSLLAGPSGQSASNSGSVSPQQAPAPAAAGAGQDAPRLPQQPSPSPQPDVASTAGLHSQPSSGQHTSGSAGEGTRGPGVHSGCSTSSPGNVGLGLLGLEVAVQADELLQELQRLVRLNREVARSLIHVWMDVLTLEQHADMVLAAYPYMPSVAPLCQLISWEVAQSAAGRSEQHA